MILFPCNPSCIVKFWLNWYIQDIPIRNFIYDVLYLFCTLALTFFFQKRRGEKFHLSRSCSATLLYYDLKQFRLFIFLPLTKWVFAGCNGNSEHSTKCGLCCKLSDVNRDCSWVLCAYITCFLGKYVFPYFYLI